MSLAERLKNRPLTNFDEIIARSVEICQIPWIIQSSWTRLGGAFNYFKSCFFSPLREEMIQFDEHIFQVGWFNHPLVEFLRIEARYTPQN